MTVTVRDAGSHYEVTVDGVHAGLATYRRHGDRVVFTHTEIDAAFEGKGIGSELARQALDDVAARGLLAVPLCPFLQQWIARHSGYAALVAAP